MNKQLDLASGFYAPVIFVVSKWKSTYCCLDMEIYLNRTCAVVPSQALIGLWEISPNIFSTSSSVSISILIFASEHVTLFACSLLDSTSSLIYCTSPSSPLFIWPVYWFLKRMQDTFSALRHLRNRVTRSVNSISLLSLISVPLGIFFEKKLLLFFYEKNLDTDFEK